MHRKYHTEAIVLSGFESGEADVRFLLLTREFGLISALAKGIRKVESKLRYALQDSSFSDISLVRGREIWRLVNASPKENYLLVLAGEPEKSRAVAEIVDFLKRFLHGEEKDEKLFNILLSGLRHLSETENANVKSAKTIMTLRMLGALGYLKDKEKFARYLEAPWGEYPLSAQDGAAFSEAIDASIMESHL